MSGWEDLLNETVELSQKESELTAEAEACRSSSVEGDDNPVPRSPQTSDLWWVQDVKAATKHLQKGASALEHPVILLSNCTGAFSEAAAMKARTIASGLWL